MLKIPKCLSPIVELHKLSKAEINDLKSSEKRKKSLKAFMQKSRAARNISIDKNRNIQRKELQEDNIKKIKAFQKFLECSSGNVDISYLRDEIAILRTEFDAISDVDIDSCSVASSSFSESSRPRRKISAPQRFTVSTQSPAKPKNKKNSKYFDPNGAYEVEEIRNMNLINNQVYFYVKWKNYSSKVNTWEPLENVRDCDALEKFLSYEKKGEEENIKRECDQLLKEHQEEVSAYLAKPKPYIMNELKQFDPLTFQSYQIMYMMVKNQKNYYINFRKSFRKMLILNYLHERDVEQYEAHKKIVESIRKHENNVFSVSIENNVDFEVFKSFNYVHENILPNNVVLRDEASGCDCPEGCDKESKSCCPTKEKCNFAYKHISGKKRLRLGRPQMIVECNENCKCGENCLNRVTQQPRLFPLRIFKTINDRGWGLKTMANIPRGSFIIEYTGQIIDQDESLFRGKMYDEIGQSYLFDLDYNEKSDAVYTIDAFSCGNISRLINHSCDPNCEIWPVSTCGQNPLIYKLCFFSTRLIKEGEELTFDYNGGTVELDKSVVEERDSFVTGNQISRRFTSKDVCKCGSEFCRGFIFNRKLTEVAVSVPSSILISN